MTEFLDVPGGRIAWGSFTDAEGAGAHAQVSAQRLLSARIQSI